MQNTEGESGFSSLYFKESIFTWEINSTNPVVAVQQINGKTDFMMGLHRNPQFGKDDDIVRMLELLLQQGVLPNQPNSAE